MGRGDGPSQNTRSQKELRKQQIEKGKEKATNAPETYSEAGDRSKPKGQSPSRRPSFSLTTEAKHAIQGTSERQMRQLVNQAVGWSSDPTESPANEAMDLPPWQPGGPNRALYEYIRGKNTKDIKIVYSQKSNNICYNATNHVENVKNTIDDAKILFGFANQVQRIHQFAEALDIDFDAAQALVHYGREKDIPIDKAQKVLAFAQEKGVPIADLGENILEAWGDMSEPGYYLLHDQYHVAFIRKHTISEHINDANREFSDLAKEMGFKINNRQIVYLKRTNDNYERKINGWTMVYRVDNSINEEKTIKLQKNSQNGESGENDEVEVVD